MNSRQRIKFNDGLGRIPVGPARGSRGRERRAASCKLCEGDLWIEAEDGSQVPCECRTSRSARRVRNQTRAGGWWQGSSLSFAAPPLASVPVPVRDSIERLCAQVSGGADAQGLWITAGPELGKSALCAYLAQRLYRSDHVVAERTGNLLAHLRWLGAVRGEAAVEERLRALVEVPLLVLDDIDRPVRSHASSVPLAFRASFTGSDLIRLSGLLRDRHAELQPIVVTSRCRPEDCAERSTAITRDDLLRGLLSTAGGAANPFEDFPDYSLRLFKGAIRDLRDTCTTVPLQASHQDAAAA